MSEALYSFEQMAKVSGQHVQNLERKRRLFGLEYKAKGYTAQECRQIIGEKAPLKTPGEIGPRARKALALLTELAKLEPKHD